MMKNLPIPDDVPMLQCDRCGTEYADDETAEAVDRALKAVHDQRLRQMAIEAMDVIEEAGVPAAVIEKLLGLSGSYLSRLRSSNRTPSPQLVLHLRKIALSPSAQVLDIQRLWTREGKPGKRTVPPTARKPAGRLSPTRAPQRQAGGATAAHKRTPVRG